MTTSVIIGANRGIGLEFCRQLKARGDEVIAVCRKSNNELDSLGVQVQSNVEVSDLASLSDLATALKGQQIDLLIHNAGIMLSESIDEMDFDSVRQQLEVNALGPLQTVATLLPLMASPSKVALITSRMGSMTDNTSGGMYGYRMSKCALNMAGVSLSHDLKDRNISVAILHPGYVKTDLTGQRGNITTDESVNGLLQRIDELTLENSGTFWHTDGQVLPW